MVIWGLAGASARAAAQGRWGWGDKGCGSDDGCGADIVEAGAWEPGEARGTALEGILALSPDHPVILRNRLPKSV